MGTRGRAKSSSPGVSWERLNCVIMSCKHGKHVNMPVTGKGFPPLTLLEYMSYFGAYIRKIIKKCLQNRLPFGLKLKPKGAIFCNTLVPCPPRVSCQDPSQML